MKVVRKGKCDSRLGSVIASDIPMQTVFSGNPRPFECKLYGRGVFLRCLTGFIRLEYEGGPDDHLCDFLFDNDTTVEDYKELNAYLCIEE